VISLNAIEMIKLQLEQSIQETVLDRIVDEETKKFRDRIHQELEPVVRKITLDKITTFKDHLSLRDELACHISINGKKTTDKI